MHRLSRKPVLCHGSEWRIGWDAGSQRKTFQVTDYSYNIWIASVKTWRDKLEIFKKVSLFFYLSLSGCVVADMDSSNYRYPPYIQTFQKPLSLGHTDVQQRRTDLYACGVSKNHPLHSWDETFRRNNLVGGESMEQHDYRISKLENCMKEKGYELFDYGSCGPLKKPSGICN